MKYLAASAFVAVLLFTSACTQSSQKLVEAGNRYHAAKKYKEASILYQKALTKDKTNAEAYYRQGLNLLDMRDIAGAVPFLRRAVDLKPSNTDATTKLAEIYLLAYSQNPQKFKTYLDDIRDLVKKVSQYQPNSFAVLRLQGLYDLANKDPERALEAFAKANQIKPYSPDVVTWYAETLYNQKRVDEAEALERGMLAHDKKWGPGYDFLLLIYSKAAEQEKDPAKKAADTAKAKAVLEDRVKNDPSNPIAIRNLASYDVSTGNYTEGEAVIQRALADPKAFPRAHELVGDFYFNNRKFDHALQQYQAGISQDPKNALAYNERIVELYQVTNRRNDAINLARTLAKQNPKDQLANELYAGLLMQVGTREAFAQSVGELKDLVKGNPTNPMLHLDLARAYFDTNDFDKSLSEAQDAMQDEMKQAQTTRRGTRPQVIDTGRVIMGRIYDQRGQYAKAMEQANFILQTDPTGPQSADAKYIKAWAQIGIGQGDQAMPALESLLQQYPFMGPARLELAKLYLSKGRFDDATAQYQEFVKRFPTDLRGPVGLQTVKLAEGKADDALAGMQALVNQNQSNLQLRYQLAAFQAQAGAQVAAKDHDRAKQLYQQAANNYKEILKTTANSADVWLRLGILQRELGENDAALASFQQANNADPHNGTAELNAAMLLESLGKKKEAIAAYNKVLGVDPENTLAMNNVAFLNAEDGMNLDQAVSYAEKAKKKAPDSPDVSDTLGYVYLQKQRPTEALVIFKDLVASHQDNPTFRFHLAMALDKSGEKGAARDEAQKALQLSKEPGQQNQIKSFLSQLG